MAGNEAAGLALIPFDEGKSRSIVKVKCFEGY